MQRINVDKALATLSTDLTNTPMAQEHRRLCSKMAATMFRCYRTTEADNPESYLASVVAVLANYHPDVVREVCDPTRGLPVRLKFLPTLAEVREACEQGMEPVRKAAVRQASIEEQFQEREKWDGAPRVPQPEPRGQILSNYDEAVAKHGRPFGVFEKDRQLPYRG